MTRSDTSPFHKPLRHGKYGEAHDCRPLAFDSRDKEGAEALYGVGAGLVVAFAGGRVGAEHVFGPLREGHVGGVVKQFRPAFPVSRQPDDAAPRVYGMRPAREVQQHGEGFVAAGGLAEDDRAVCSTTMVSDPRTTASGVSGPAARATASALACAARMA